MVKSEWRLERDKRRMRRSKEKNEKQKETIKKD
jgi:hypothetical protein